MDFFRKTATVIEYATITLNDEEVVAMRNLMSMAVFLFRENTIEYQLANTLTEAVKLGYHSPRDMSNFVKDEVREIVCTLFNH